MVKKLLSGYHILLFLILTTFNGYGQCPTSVSVTTDPGTSICAGTTVSFTANPTGGSNYLYQWMINGTSVTGATNQTFTTSNLQNAEVITVKVTSSSETTCTGKTSNGITMTVNEVLTPSLTITASTNDICPGTSVSFTPNPINGGTNPTYKWFVNGTLAHSGSSYTTGNLENAQVVTAEMTSSAQCVSVNPVTSSNSVTMVVKAGTPAVPGAISGSATIPGQVCPGTSQTYSITPVENATEYIWTLPNGWTGSSSTPSINVTTGTTGGAITVKAKNVCGTSTAQTFDVTVKAGTPEAPGTITGETAVCPGSAQTYSIATVTGASEYIWTLPTGWSGSSTTNSIAVTAGNSGNGNITVKAVNDCGTSTAQTLAVSVKPGTPAVPGAISGNTAVCPGVSETFSIAAVPNATEYIWTLPTGWTGTSTSNSITVTTGTTDGNISVQAVNDCGTSTEKSLPVTVKAGTPSVPTDLSGATAVCPGSTETYSVTAVTGVTYIWTLPSGWTGTSTTNTIDVTFPDSGSGNISVVATNDCGTSSATSIAVTISAPAPVMTGTISGPESVCSGSSGLVYSIEAIANTDNYAWTVPAGWTITSGADTNSITVTAGSSGDISVIAKNECGESSSISKTITATSAVPAQPQPINSTLTSTAVCPPAEIDFWVPAVTGATGYTWTMPDGWEILSGENTERITVRITSNAQYSASESISVTADNICGSSAVTTLDGIAIGDYVIADLGDDIITCSSNAPIEINGTISFGGNSGLKIQSVTSTGTNTPQGNFNGKTTVVDIIYTPSDADLEAGQVTITVITEKPSGACAAGEDQVTIFFKDLPTASISAVSPVCQGSSSLLTFTGTPNSRVTYQIGTGANQTIDIGPSGTATVDSGVLTADTTVNLISAVNTDTPACTNSNLTGSFNIVVTPQPTATITYAGAPFCSSLSTVQPVTLTGTNAYTGGTYSAPAGLTIDPVSGSITPGSSTPGTYTVTYETPASGGCEAAVAVATTEVTITKSPTAAISYEGTPFCTSDSAAKPVTLTGTDGYTGGTYSAPAGLTIDPVSGVITPSSSTPGSYTVTYETPTSGGCSPVAVTTEVVITALPTATLTYSNSPYCNSDTAAKSPTLSGTGVFEGGSYSAPAGLTIDPVSGAITPSSSTPGSYTITYTTPTSAGCGEATATAEIIITETPTAEISYSGPFCTSVTESQAVSFSNTAGAYTGGTFTASPGGLLIDSSTGAITPQSSDPGVYAITYTTPEAGGCAPISISTEVIITQAPNVTFSYQTPLCTSDTNPYTVTFATGTAEAYKNGTFTGTQGLAIDASGTIIAANSTPGIHTVTYTIPAANGCGSVSFTTEVEIIKEVMITTQPVNVGICSTQPASFEVVASGDNLTYQWFRGDGTEVVGADSAVLSFANATSADEGAYYVVVSGSTPCGAKTSNTVTLNVDENIVIIKPAEPIEVCDSNLTEASFEFIAHANGVPLTFTWLKDGNVLDPVDGKFVMVVSEPTGENGEYTGTLTIHDVVTSDNGVYAVRINGPDYFTCSEAVSKGFSLSVSPLPDAPIVEDISYCQGVTAAPLTAEGVELKWYSTADATEPISTPTPSTTTPGVTSYWVSQTPGLCESPRAEIKVTVNATPPAPGTNPILEFCYGDPADPLTATATNGNTLNWYGQGANNEIIPLDTAPTPNTQNTGIFKYWVSQTTAEGCESERVEIIVNVYSLPELTIAADSVLICEGSSTILHATGADTYSWTVDGVEIATGADPTVNPVITTTYTVTGTNNNGCVNTANITVEVDKPSVGGIITAPASVCIGANSGELVLSGYTGEIQRWEKSTDSGVTWTAINSTTETMSFENLAVSTSFRAFVKNGVCGEVASEIAVINVDPKPVGGILAFDIVTADNNGRIFLVCQNAGPGYATPLTASGFVGEIYAWNYRKESESSWSTIKTGAGENFTENILSADQIEALGSSETIVFQVEIKSGACVPNAFSRTAILSVLPTDITPSPVEVSPTEICIGEIVTLTGGTGFSENPELWKGGAFDNASITEHGWRIRRQNDPKDLGFDTDANNTEFDRWKRATPREFTTASLTPPHTTYLQLYDTGIEDGNKGFALVSGNYSSTMETPVFSLGGTDEAVLTFDQAYNLTPGARIMVEISTDGGNTYDTLYIQTGADLSGNFENFGEGTVESRPKNKIRLDLGEYMGYNNLRIRFNYIGLNSGDVWAVDNIEVPGGPQDVGMTWRDYTDPDNPVIIGTSNTETWTPKKIGLNIFEFQTKLVFDSQGDACDVAINADTTSVFVFDKYTSVATAVAGTCGDFSVQLDGVMTGLTQGLITSYPTADGSYGQWEIMSSPEGYVYDETDFTSSTAGAVAINDPKAVFTPDVAGNYTLRWTVMNDRETKCENTNTDATFEILACTTLDFDGVDDYVDLGTGYTGSYSIGAWIRPEALTGTIISGPNFELSMDDLPAGIVANDRWYHIAATSDGELYVDGILVDGSMGTGGSERALIGARWNNSTGEPENYFSGWIEEVRIWNKALTPEQIRFMMNQRLQNAGNMGVEIPMPVPGGLVYSDLAGYYQLIATDILPGGLTADLALTAFDGILHNMETTQENTAPLPYYSANAGLWTTDATWARPDVWDIPNAKGIDNATPIEWNIVRVAHNIQSDNKDITVLGLLSESGTLEIADPTVTDPHWKNDGQMLRVTHYLNLDGNIDLTGESQLLQDVGSIVDTGSTGWLERDQQGTANSFNYNYWSSPVSPAAGNAPYTVAGVMMDGTLKEPRPITFGGTYHFADGGFTDPRRISTYWLHIFHGAENQYGAWVHVGSTGSIKVGEGYTMKGTSGTVDYSVQQNYTFKGLPNNGPVELNIGIGQDYLIGNPYPSAIDADKFIRDHITGPNGNNGSNVFTGTLYFWSHFTVTSHYLKEYIGGYATYNLSGGVIAAATDERINATEDEGGLIPQKYIPVGQSFFVKTTADPALAEVLNVQGGTIEFNNSHRIYQRETDGESVFHVAKGNRTQQFKTPDTQRQQIWLKFHSPMGYHRQLLVTKDENASDGFDLGYDAPLIENNEEDMYWFFENVPFVIQGVDNLDHDQELPLGMKVKEEGAFTIEIDKLANIPSDMDIFVRDSLTNTYHNLREGPYKGTSATGVFENRLSIVFKDPTVLIPPDEPDLEPIYDEFEILYVMDSREIIIRNPNLHQIDRVYLTNMLGQRIDSYYDIPTQHEVRLPVRRFSQGIFIVKLHSDVGVLTVKILLE